MNVVICDDSALARKSLHRNIHSDFELNYQFCTNGREALVCLSQHNIDVLFLDLTMPVMDGFEVLHSLPVSTHKTTVIVVSGDIQQTAKQRCLSLGAYEFIEKPFKQDEIRELLTQLNAPLRKQSHRLIVEEAIHPACDIDPLSKFREITNIALGKGAAIVSDKIGAFINMPLPTVGMLEASELKMTIIDALQRKKMHAVTQRFVGSGFHGEAMACMRGKGMSAIGHKLGFSTTESNQDEIALNVANLLISTFLNSLAHQLVVNFSLRQPMVLHSNYLEKTSLNHIKEGAFTIEFTYEAENVDFECEVLLFVDSESVEVIYRLMETL
jgi:CheY-like chemotaxis protein